ncbi:MAG: hypothetical protein JO279_10340 [Verrucomicrobia bacterium]|nr:hypothetical protein [Verrucomicrobiota bacterium]
MSNAKSRFANSQGGAERAALKILYQRSLSGTVLFGVLLCGVFSMLGGMQVVAMRDMGMMSGFFVISTGMVLSCFFMMAGRMFMVFRRFCVMFCTFLAHNWGSSVSRENIELQHYHRCANRRSRQQFVTLRIYCQTLTGPTIRRSHASASVLSPK